MGGVGLSIAKEMLPALKSAVVSLAAIAKEGDLAKNVATLLSGALSAGVGVLKAYSNAVDRVSIAFGVAAKAGAAFAEIQKNLGPGGIFTEGSVTGGIQKIKDAFAEGQRELDDLINRQNNKFAGVTSRVLGGGSAEGGTDSLALQRALAGGGGGKKARSGKSDAEKEAESLARSYKSMNDRLDEQIALFGKTGEAA